MPTVLSAGNRSLSLPTELKWSPYIPHTPTGKQLAFLLLGQAEALYGGSAGGGKSDALLMAALQYADMPGYAALLLRRNYADLALPGALMDRAAEWLGGRAQWRATEHTWRFPSGATLTFGYLDTAGDKFRYQSSAFQFCVRQDTPVLMADNTWRPINAIRPGDSVATLEGPRPVLRTHVLGSRPAVQVSTAYGDAYIGMTHAILVPDGSWASPNELLSTQSHSCGSSGASSWPTPQGGHTPGVCLSEDQRLQAVPGLQNSQGKVAQGCGVSAVDGQNGDAMFDDSRQDFGRRRKWCGQLMLCERVLLSRGLADDEKPDAPSSSLLPGSPNGCPGGSHYDGAHILQMSRAAPNSTQLQGDVAIPNQEYCEDDPANTPECNRLLYVHPYTKVLHSRCEAVLSAWSYMVPAGEAVMLDLTIESASHYIVFPGIIARNCGWDELTQFEEASYRYLFSRLRRLEGTTVPLRMRSASNPGGIGHEWVKQRFLVEGRENGRVFIPASLADNPFLDRAAYIESLSELDPVTRAQLLHGDWSARKAGSKFRREWFGLVDDVPGRMPELRYWDLAATEAKEGQNPDWTAGVKLGQLAGIWYILDVRRARATPGEIENLIKQTAQLDGPDVAIRMEQEPGASGKSLVAHFARQVLAGYDFKGIPSTGAKELRANPLSSAAEAGNIKLLRRTWVGPLLDELEAFPQQGYHDDQVDALAGAFACLRSRLGLKPAEAHDLLGRSERRDNPLGLDLDNPKYQDMDMI